MKDKAGFSEGDNFFQSAARRVTLHKIRGGALQSLTLLCVVRMLQIAGEGPEGGRMTLDPAETALEQALSAHEKTARDNAAAREQRPSDARPDLDALHETTDATVKAWLAVKSLVDEAQRIAEQGRPALLQRARR